MDLRYPFWAAAILSSAKRRAQDKANAERCTEHAELRRTLIRRRYIRYVSTGGWEA